MGVPGLTPVLTNVLGNYYVSDFPIACDAVIIDCNIIFHQCYYKYKKYELPFFQEVEQTLILKLRTVFQALVEPCAVYFCFDGISGKVKSKIQKKRRQMKPMKNHLLPCTHVMYQLEQTVQLVTLKMDLASAYLSSSFVPGETDFKALQICASQPEIRNVLIMSTDNDFLAIALLKLTSYENIYIHNQLSQKMIHVNLIQKSLLRQHIDPPLFVFACFIFGNDYSPSMCTLSTKHMQQLLLFLKGKDLSFLGLRMRPEVGSHTWTIGHSVRVSCWSKFYYRSFFQHLFLHVPIKRTYTLKPVYYKQFLWNLKYYFGDPDTNLSHNSRCIHDATHNSHVLKPKTYHSYLDNQLFVPGKYEDYFQSLC